MVLQSFTSFVASLHERSERNNANLYASSRRTASRTQSSHRLSEVRLTQHASRSTQHVSLDLRNVPRGRREFPRLHALVLLLHPGDLLRVPLHPQRDGRALV